ncbi:MAG: InlB B-repeat-containing protein [Candidatus Rokuibacteriota bacterium]
MTMRLFARTLGLVVTVLVGQLLVPASAIAQGFSVQTFYTLVTMKAGDGDGTIRSSPFGISCGATCSAAILEGTAVTLTVTPTADSFFVGWGGACTGIEPCVLVMNGAKTVTANFTSGGPPPSSPQAILVAAVLPSSRSVRVGVTATAFAVMINAGTVDAIGCRIAPRTAIPATFGFRTTDPSTNLFNGLLNAFVDIPRGRAQTFVIFLTPTSAFPSTEVVLEFACSNAPAAPIIVGLNTLLLSASAGAIPDIVALAATLNNDGIVHAPIGGAGAFAVATVNVGSSAGITVTADTGSVVLPINISLCSTNPVTGQCASGIGPTATAQIDENATPTFAVFVVAGAPVHFAPGSNRIFVRFRDASGGDPGVHKRRGN